MDGIINVYKEKGFTSHDVVAKLRGILHMKRIGHTGTLDPDAVGVLPVMIGRGTKLGDMLTDTDKTYESVMLLGTVTDTQDITGKVLKTNPVAVSDMEVLDAVCSFVGEYDQIPPMYSALKKDGRKLYELARQGIEVERSARRVHIRSIHINEIDLDESHPTVTITVTCSKGTYIRTLIHDIGAKLGTGACMESLIRTRAGRFTVDESVTLNQITALALKGEVESVLIPADEMFDYPKVSIRAEAEKLLYNGNVLPLSAVEESDNAQPPAAVNVRVYDKDGQFIGIYTSDTESLTPVKMFYSRDEQA